jgi:MoxR-like ATPase
MVIITSNRTRELHDALKRRCVYHWIDYPDAAKELAIVRSRLPDVAAGLASQVVAFVQALRREDLAKRPGVAETLDWAEALTYLGATELSVPLVMSSIGLLLKYQDDVDALRAGLAERLLEEAQRG